MNANGAVEPTELVAGDSVTFSFAGSDVTSDIVAMVPEKNVRRAVSEWLDESLGGTFDGDKEDMGAIVGYYGNMYVDTLNSISSQGVPDYAELSYYARMRNCLMLTLTKKNTKTKTKTKKGILKLMMAGTRKRARLRAA